MNLFYSESSTQPRICAPTSADLTTLRSKLLRTARLAIHVFSVLATFAVPGVAPIASAQSQTPFSGWEAIRVIEQNGRPQIVRSADVDGNGSSELMVVNTRYSRIDLYEHLDEPRTPDVDGDYKPNAIPMSPDIERTEIQLEQLPTDAIAIPTSDGSGKESIAVLVSEPTRLLIYDRDSSKAWSETRRVELLDGSVASAFGSLLLDESGDTPVLLLAFEEGTQRIKLNEGSKPTWITPRGKRTFADWWLADLDGDGKQDLIEQVADEEVTLSWRPGRGDSQFGPSRSLFDRSILDIRILGGFEKAPVVALDGSARGMVRRYDYAKGEASPSGQLRPLPLAGGRDSAWTSMQLAGKPALVCADPDRPRLLTYQVEDQGWSSGQTFPSVADIQALASPLAASNSLLLWVKDSADLYRSEWQGTRLSYPQPWVQDEDLPEERSVLALDSVGATTWWAQQVKSDLDLYIWSKDDSAPKRVRFPKIGSAVEKVLWIGSDRLLVRDRRARGIRIVEVKDGKVNSLQPAHLKRADFDEFQCLAVGEDVRPARFADGVMQWLADDLSPIDQIMLRDGRELVGYSAESDTTGWALEKGAPYLHRIEPDESGVAQASERIKVIEATEILQDPNLGRVLVGRDSITLCQAGAPDKLQQIEAIDERKGKASGYGTSAVQRFLIADIDQDGQQDILFCNDTKHRLKAMCLVENELKELIEWPVYEDLTYPYGGEYGDDYETEPRAVCAFDFDGDPYPDLALLCHDRLLIYLGREQK